MKADVAQQKSLLELAELDATLSRIEYKTKNLAEQQKLDEVQAAHREASDRLAALQLAIEDLDAQIAKLESEIDSVRQREERDRKLMAGGSVDAKQLTELQHELETLERRQSALEDSQLEVMERREELQRDQQEVSGQIDSLEADLGLARAARDSALVELDEQRHKSSARREELVAGLDPELVALYEKVRSRGGAGAGQLQGRRCGACRIEIDQGEFSRINAAAEDDVTRCPECGAILLRIKGTGA
ncbi:zinc ribbon domain-containing protein [Mycolicibacterium phlei]